MILYRREMNPAYKDKDEKEFSLATQPQNVNSVPSTRDLLNRRRVLFRGVLRWGWTTACPAIRNLAIVDRHPPSRVVRHTGSLVDAERVLQRRETPPMPLYGRRQRPPRVRSASSMAKRKAGSEYATWELADFRVR